MENQTDNTIEIVLKSPNPLFVKWVSAWLEKAEIQNSKSRFILREALDSLNRFPLPLSSGRDCAILRGFGRKLCSLIDNKLTEYDKLNLKNAFVFDQEVKKVAKKYKHDSILKYSKGCSSGQVSTPANSSASNQILMSDNKFVIILLVDIQETTGKSKNTIDATRSYLESQKIKYDVRKLSVGDFCWICKNEENEELILPYIIERKRMDDFASSIRDGRFHEQKFRLKGSGIPNLIYLIENYGNNQHVSLPITTLMQAATNTQIHNGFQVKFTDNHNHSMMYVVALTQILIQLFRDKVLIGTNKSDIQNNDKNSNFIALMTFQEFNTLSSKNKTTHVKEVFAKQLIQLKSLSIDKAIAITDIYPTPKSLLLAYNQCKSKEEAEKLLSTIRCGNLKRPIGLAISKVMYDFYS